MDSTKVKVISVSISLIGVAALFLYKVYEAFEKRKRYRCEADHPFVSEESVTSKSVVLKWKEPLKKLDVSEVHRLFRPLTLNTDDCNCVLTGLKPNTKHEFEVLHIGSDGHKWVCQEPILSVTTLPSEAHSIKDKSNEIRKGPPSVYKLALQLAGGKDGKSGKTRIIQHVYGMQSENKDEKTILIFGPDENRKNAVIDGILNFILEVSVDDDFRLSVGHDYSGKKGTDEKKSATCMHLKVFTTRESRIPYTVNIIDVPSSFQSEDIEKFSEDLAKVGVTSLNSVVFVPTDSILSTCGINLGSCVCVFNSSNDIPQSEFSFRECSINSENSTMNSSLFACQHQKNIFRFRQHLFCLQHIGFKTFFDELKCSNEVSVKVALKVHLLQRNIEKNVKEYEIASKRAFTYIKEIKSNISNLINNKPLFYLYKSDETPQYKMPKDLTLSELLQKVETAYIKDSTSKDKIYCTYCNECKKLCHLKCSLNEERFRRSPCKTVKKHKCTECKCVSSQHAQAYFCQSKIAPTELDALRKITKSAQIIVDDIKKDYEELKRHSWCVNPLQCFNFCVILIETEHVVDIELGHCIPSFKTFCNLETKEAIIVNLNKNGLPWDKI